MSAEENKALVRRAYEEIFNKKNIAVLEEFYSTEWVWHLAPSGLPQGLEGYRQQHTMVFAAFPDLQTTIEDMIAERDKVAVRWTATGTHKGEFMGIAPTGKQVTMTGIDIERIAGGKIVETWGLNDVMGMMQQLGVKLGGR